MSDENEQYNEDYDKGTRSLKLSVNMNSEFDDIKNFGNFDKAYFHNFYHSFYSLALSYSARLLSNNPDFDFKQIDFEEFNLVDNEKLVNSIASDQLKNHDCLFKIIAYWYLLKKGDEQPFKVLCQPNRARKICEGIFAYNWETFKITIKNFDSSYPNYQMLDLIKDELEKNQ